MGIRRTGDGSVSTGAPTMIPFAVTVCAREVVVRVKQDGLPWMLAATASLVFGLVFTPATHAQASTVAPLPPRLTAINAGNPTLRVTPIQVNIVTIGYPRGSIDTNRLVSMLPVDGEPYLREPAFRGYGYAVGDEYQYQYQVRSAGRVLEDAFFNHLAHAGTVGAPDYYQSAYNAEVHNSLDVGPKVRFIDAQDTERWLEHNAEDALDINPHDYTVFLIDWYSRKDFQFHVYTNPSNPDPDTGTDARLTLSQPHVRAWGGTSGPTWFLDLSAGPVYTDGSFNVDTADLNGTGTTDLRLPPIWDYGHTGYRAFDDLTGDLAKTIRYAAIDDMFTSSPLFDPLATQPLPGTGKQVALDVFEGDPNTNGVALVHPNLVLAQLRRLQPYAPITMSVRDLPLTGGALTAYGIGSLASVTPDCWNSFADPFSEFFCYFIGNYPSYFPTATANVVIPEVGFTVADNPTQRLGFVGNTDDNYATGTPSLIEMFDDAPLRAANDAYAYTLLATHETGHFLGLSHPHDGQDPAQLIDFGPDGDYFVAWAGDESDSVMSYLPGNLSFDVFDIENLARSTYAREATSADYYAGVLLAQPPNARVYQLLTQADGNFHAADAAVRSERWPEAGAEANAGFLDIERALQIDGLLPSETPTTASAVTATTSALANTPHLTIPMPRPLTTSPADHPCIAEETCTPAIAGSGS
jgi:hypothetical protein